MRWGGAAGRAHLRGVFRIAVEGGVGVRHPGATGGAGRWARKSRCVTEHDERIGSVFRSLVAPRQLSDLRRRSAKHKASIAD